MHEMVYFTLTRQQWLQRKTLHRKVEGSEHENIKNTL